MTEPVQSDQAQPEAGSGLAGKFWDQRFVLSIFILVGLAIIAAYLEYVYYPLLLASGQFGETGISLHLSFLTFQYDAIRGSEGVPGIPSLDFFQIFLISILLFGISHYFDSRRTRSGSSVG